MQRVALINGNNINQDHDLSKIFEAFWEPWVVDGLVVQPGKVLAWFWFVHINREWKNFVVLFENTEDFPIDTSWTKKVFVEILREKIIDWSWNAEDWSWIWHIKVSPDYPAENFMKLARIENGRIIDERNVVKAKHPLLNNFNKSNQLLKLDWDWRVPEGNLPPMNININWLPKTDFKWNMSLIAYDNTTKRNYKFPTNHISERFETIENNMRNKSAIIQTDITREKYPETGNIDGKEITINHNLGVMPKMIQVLGNNFEWFWSNWKQIWKVAHTDIGVDRVSYSDENTPRNEIKMAYSRVNNDSDMIWIVEVWLQHIVIKARFGLTLRYNSREALQWKIVFLLTN